MSDCLVLRDAVREDAAAVAAVHVATWQLAYRGTVPDAYLTKLTVSDQTAQWRRILMNSKVRTIVAQDTDIVGFVSIGPASDIDAKGLSELFALYVLPDRWGSGIGRRLCEAAITDARSLKFPKMVLWVFADNYRARKFYDSAGFRPDGHSGEWRGGSIGIRIPKLRYARSLHLAS